MKTNYLTGPSFLSKLESSVQPDIEVMVPNNLANAQEQVITLTGIVTEHDSTSPENEVGSDVIVPLTVRPVAEITRYSSFSKLVRVLSCVLKFISRLKKREVESVDLSRMAINNLIRAEQQIYFPEIQKFFKDRPATLKCIPNIVMQLNLYLDENGIIRVKSKFKFKHHPILLPKDSHLTRIIIGEVHISKGHIGLFTVLRELRRQFWIPRGFSTVRSILKDCITCKKLNQRPIALNCNSYRDFRCDPPRIPFSYVFLDYIGPMTVKIEGKSKKVWILLITCLWSRAVSLEVCYSADTNEFLRAIQMHVYDKGLFTMCLSDLGSQIVAGSNVISDFLKDYRTDQFFQEHGITKLSFEQYAKGNSSLGGLVESLVKQVKHLIIKSIGKNVMRVEDFQLLVRKTMHLANRRPIALKEGLRSSDSVDVPEPITPEMLVHGRELLSLNIIPQLQTGYTTDPNFEPNPKQFKLHYDKLQRANENLFSTYHQEFLTNLISQAIDKKSRYRPVSHKKLLVGDVVLLVEREYQKA